MNNSLSISYLDDYDTDEFYQFEVESKGLLSGVYVSISESLTYRFTFYDLARVQQDIEEFFNNGESFFYEPNLIVLPKLTKNRIENTIFKLYIDNMFSNFKEE